MPVPEPALVLAERSLLPGLDTQEGAEQVLLFGSWFEPSQALLRRADSQEFVWKQVCRSKTGVRGAVWDELIANDDRHFKNFLFAGSKWLLIDHDKALPPLAEIIKEQHGLTEYRTAVNQLARRMLSARPQDHGLEIEASLVSNTKRKLDLMTHFMTSWQAENRQIAGIYKHSETVLRTIAIRTAAISLLMQRRLRNPETGILEWTSSSQ
jgi:hypothetical protein